MNWLNLLGVSLPMQIESVQLGSNRLYLQLATVSPMVCCSLCGHQSGRIHSHYQRHLQDLPWGKLAVSIELNCRKFFCDNAACQRIIFTEPLPDFANRYARRTERLQQLFYWLGLALSGEAAARLSRRLCCSTSGDTILRSLRRRIGQRFPIPRVLGVDDFAFRRGQRYGTLLVDLERHRVVDLLPDREAETLVTWLRSHAGVEVISRDRAEAYADGARRGAPQAMQVADRWHLLKNVTAAVEKILLREHRALHLASQPEVIQVSVPSIPASFSGSKTTPFTTRPIEQEKQDRRERRLVRYQQVIELYAQGLTIRGVARSTQLSRKTVRRYVEAPVFPEMRTRPPRPTQLARFQEFLQTRWEQGCHNASQLYRESCARGYQGGLTQVREYLRRFRKDETALPPNSVRGSTKNITKNTVPSLRTVLRWLLKPDEQLDEEKQQLVRRLCQLSPKVRQARELALWFFRLVRERRPEEFGAWIAAAMNDREGHSSPLKGFAQKLLSDRAAVVAALSQPWSNGQTEGQVNRLKLIKRQMYGRGSFDLLRARVLAVS